MTNPIDSSNTDTNSKQAELPQFIPLHQAVAEASMKLKDRSFSLRVTPGFVDTEIQLAKGEFNQDLYLPSVTKLVEMIVKHYNSGYMRPQQALINAIFLAPVPVQFIDELVVEADKELDYIQERKEEYAKL